MTRRPSKNAPAAERILERHLAALRVRTDRMFAVIMLIQWIGGIIVAAVVTPGAWEGGATSTHLHLLSAVFIGALLSAAPIVLILTAPGTMRTAHVIAVCQILWSALLIHLTGGRLETHFHVFGSLAFLAVYRSPSVLVVASLVAVLDHVVLGLFWPGSIYGVLTAQDWRWIEHGGWILFENVFLLISMRQSVRSMRIVALQTADLKTANQAIEAKVKERTRDLVEAHSAAISATERAEELVRALSDETGERRQLLEAIRMILISTDSEGRVKWWNALAESTTGIAASDAVGHALGTLDLRCDVATLERGIAETRSTARRVVFDDVKLETAAGEERVFEFSIFPLRRDDGIEGALLLGADITDGRALERTVAQSQRLESIGRLAAGVAHEINTPIQYVGDNTRFVQSSFADVLTCLDHARLLLERVETDASCVDEADGLRRALEDADVAFLADEVPRAIEQTLEGVDRVARIVRSMKEFSHPGTREKSLVDLNRAIESTITVARNEWKYVADVETAFADDLPLVPCFPGDLNQVILNLIVNASHAIADVVTKSGGKGRIEISTDVVDDHARIRVRDSGAGIPEAIRAKVFEQFFTTKGVGKGTGQGLAFARSVVVNKHGGRIDFDSRPGEGTTFYIHLPLEVVTA